MWARGYSLLNIQHEVEICSEAAVNWASYCREICLLSYVDNPEQLGGEGKTVEIYMFMLRIILIKLFLDESLGVESFGVGTVLTVVGCSEGWNARAAVFLWR